MKIKSCYPNKAAVAKHDPRCQFHHWSPDGRGICQKTDSIVKPETCGKSYEWEDPDIHDEEVEVSE